jgi:hypothetical protein
LPRENQTVFDGATELGPLMPPLTQTFRVVIDQDSENRLHARRVEIADLAADWRDTR